MRNDWRRHLLGTIGLMLAVPALAQSAPPPPKQPVNSAAGTAGFTQPGSIEAQGRTYVGPIMTKWGRAVTPDNAWRGYPRPQMVRSDWLNLNGEWDYAITGAADAIPARIDGK